MHKVLITICPLEVKNVHGYITFCIFIAAVSTVPLIQSPGTHHSLTTNNSVESSTLTIDSEPVSGNN